MCSVHFKWTPYNLHIRTMYIVHSTLYKFTVYFTSYVHLNLPVNNSTQNLWYSVNYRIHNIITYFKIWLWEETSEVVEKRNRLNIIDFFNRGLYFLFWGKRFLFIWGKTKKLEKLNIKKQLFSFIQTFYPKILLLSQIFSEA